MPGAGERRSLLLLARDSNRDMLAANDLVIGRIKSVPARARNVDFRPSMRGTVLTFAHLDVASDESCFTWSDHAISWVPRRTDPFPSVGKGTWRRAAP